jgi:type IV pilus assembly protein PilM
MPITPGVWGIDLGQCALKAIRLEEVDGQLTATAFDYVEHPKILSQPDADPDQLTREALEKFLSRNTLRGDIVSISVPGQSGLARFVKLPPVEEKKIADIVRFEAKQQIPFNLEEVVWDYQRIGSGEVSEGFAMGIEIGLFAMKRDMIKRYLDHFKEVGIEIHHVQMAPLALCNFVSYDLLGKGARVKGQEETKSNCVVALDIGADSSNLVITDGDRVIWQRPIPLGGNHFTRALTKELKLTFAKAEHLKRNALKSPDLKKILTALKPVLNDFVGEVQRSLGYFTNTHRDAQIEYLVGLGNAFRLPGLQRYLSEKLQMEVRKLPKMERLTGDAVLTQPAFSENVLTFGVAYGLALQGLKQARLLTNLLPGEIRLERLVRAKKPWAAAAVAVLLLGSAALGFKAWRETRAYTNDDVKAAVTSAESTTKNVSDAEGQYNQAKTAALTEERSIRSIVAGQPEYKNWLELTTFVSACLPQPDGRNMPDITAGDRVISTKEKYWSKPPNAGGHPANKPPFQPMTGEQAYKEWLSRLAGNKPKDDTLAKDELGVGIDDLVQINIKSFDARFTDDLAGFWDTAWGNMKKEEDNVRPREQAKKGPEGKGWIIEIQGYTWHHKGPIFLRDTLLENIATKGITQASPGPPGNSGTPGAPGTPAPGKAGPAPGPAPGGKDAPADLDIPPDGPVKNRISHVMLYKYREMRNATLTSPFQEVGRSALSELIRPSGAERPPGGGRAGNDRAGRSRAGGGRQPGGRGSYPARQLDAARVAPRPGDRQPVRSRTPRRTSRRPGAHDTPERLLQGGVRRRPRTRERPAEASADRVHPAVRLEGADALRPVAQGRGSQRVVHRCDAGRPARLARPRRADQHRRAEVGGAHDR